MGKLLAVALSRGVNGGIKIAFINLEFPVCLCINGPLKHMLGRKGSALGAVRGPKND